MVGVGGQFLYAAGTPLPDIRGDLVEDWQPTSAGGPRDSEIESCVIDRDHEIHDAAVQERDEPSFEAVKKGESWDDLGDSHDRQPVEVGE